MNTLSMDAVMALRFLVRGYRMPMNEKWLAAVRELADAGITEPDGRFTPWGLDHHQEILAREEERVERERLAPLDGRLSSAAREQLRRHIEGDNEVTAENRSAYQELVAARVMIPVHGFAGGREVAYQLTYWGEKLREQLLAYAKEAV